MKGSMLVVSFFVVGCFLGVTGKVPESILDSDVVSILLYALMLQVGISLGSDNNLGSIIRSIRPRVLLLPVATICGTLLFSALASLFISRWRLSDCLAVGSGFGYYSLSSILITELKSASLGDQLAAELGIIALMSNIFREIFTLLGTPYMVRWFGPFSAISSGGATSMDTTLPVISRYAGNSYVFVSIIHGVLVDISVPVFVTFFCSL